MGNTIFIKSSIEKTGLDISALLKRLTESHAEFESRWTATRQTFLESVEEQNYNAYKDIIKGKMLPIKVPSSREDLLHACLNIICDKRTADVMSLGDVNDFLLAAGFQELYPRALEDTIWIYLIQSKQPADRYSELFALAEKTILDDYRVKLFSCETPAELTRLVKDNRRQLIKTDLTERSKRYMQRREQLEKLMNSAPQENLVEKIHTGEVEIDFTYIPDLVFVYLVVNNMSMDGFDELFDTLKNEVESYAAPGGTEFVDRMMMEALTNRQLLNQLSMVHNYFVRSNQEKMLDRLDTLLSLRLETVEPGTAALRSALLENIPWQTEQERMSEKAVGTIVKRLYDKYSDHNEKILARSSIIELCVFGLGFSLDDLNDVLTSGGYAELDVKNCTEEAFFYYLLEVYMPLLSDIKDIFTVGNALREIVTHLSEEDFSRLLSLFSRPTGKLLELYREPGVPISD